MNYKYLAFLANLAKFTIHAKYMFVVQFINFKLFISFQLLAAPFAAGALFLPTPWCFLSLIPSNVIGEMWVGVASATIIDVAPTVIRTSSIAIYLFIITIIGGNFNVLVSPIQDAFRNVMSGSDEAVNRNSLRWAVFSTFPMLYVVSSVLFLFAFLLMKLVDKKVQKKCCQDVSLNQSPESSPPPEYEGVDNDS